MMLMTLLCSFLAVFAFGRAAAPAVNCPVPVSPPNGQAILSRFGGTVKYLCDPGYELKGVDFARCIDDQWMPEPPTCEPRESGCPIGTYQEGDGCTHCPMHSYTIGAAKVSIEDCLCKQGFVRDPNNKQHCADIDECSENRFGCSHECINVPGSAICACPTEYHLDIDRKTCIPVTCPGPPMPSNSNVECNLFGEDNNETSWNSIIAVEMDEFPINTTCRYECMRGYRLTSRDILRCNEDGKWSGALPKCKSCPIGTYQEGDSCTYCPMHSYTIGAAKVSIEDCLCKQGFVRDPNNKQHCADIDECSENRIGCSHECINVPGSAICACPTGYHLDIDRKTCIDIDECSVKNGGCVGLCNNFIGGYNCSCLQGYRKQDFYSCSDVDECSEKNGLCSQKCVNFPGGYYCSCDIGYKLDFTQKSCVAVTCPLLPSPLNSKVKCYEPHVTDERTRNSYQNAHLDELPVNTTCHYECNPGFKPTSHAPLRCKKDGKWSGNPPECKKMRCPPLKIPKNGNVYPKTCKKNAVKVLQVCFFTCNTGYKINQKHNWRRCMRNKMWSNPVFPECIPIEVSPHIVCPADISVVLPPGESFAELVISKPITNVINANLTWEPSTVQLDSVTLFRPGTTEISFEIGGNTSCSTLVAVRDAEEPGVVFCPQSFAVEANSSLGVAVTWDEPVFIDNDQIVSVQKNLDSNSTLASGIHYVKYIAIDAAGNKATCEFFVNVKSPLCERPVGPRYGISNCNDWSLGVICEPLCNEGFILYPQEPYMFLCDDSGVWRPSQVIQDCTPFNMSMSSSCPDGFEHQVHVDTSENICVRCPESMEWSRETKTCITGNLP